MTCMSCIAPRCGQKRWRNVSSSVCACFPPWALDDSHSDRVVAGMEEMIASWTSATIIAGLFAFYVQWFSDEKVSGERTGTGKWSREMTLERYDWAWTGTLPVLIRHSQWNMIITDSQTDKVDWNTANDTPPLMQLQIPRWKHCLVIT